jgi:hypothetical protein
MANPKAFPMDLLVSTSIMASAASILPASAEAALALAASKFLETAAGSMSSSLTASGQTISYFWLFHLLLL